jgi:hypothetical protein
MRQLDCQETDADRNHRIRETAREFAVTDEKNGEKR